MHQWQTIGWGRKTFYLAAVIQPLAGILLHLAAGGASLAYLIPESLGLLLGVWNLWLAIWGPRQRKLLGLWHVLLALFLLINIYLMWMMIGLILWIAKAD